MEVLPFSGNNNNFYETVTKMDDQRSYLNWIKDWLSSYLHLNPEDIEEGTVFADVGVDSVGAVILAGDLESYIGRSMDETLLWDFPTVGQLARHLAEEPQELVT